MPAVPTPTSVPPTSAAPAAPRASSAWQRTSPVGRALVVVGSVLAVALLVLTFVGGVFVGQARAERKLAHLAFAKRQLTENLDRPIQDRPLLQQAGPGVRGKLKEHGVRGTVVEVDGDALVLDTPDGERPITLTEQTKIVQGDTRAELDRSALKPGVNVLVLSAKKTAPQDQADQQPGPLPAGIIVINPPQGGPTAEPQR